MSGVASAVALGVMAAATVAGTTMSAINANKANSMQKQGLADQKKAQDEAQSQAISQQRRSEMAMNAANQKQPDVMGIMQRAGGGAGGPGATMLTGRSGASPGGMDLGRTSLLGG